MSRYRFLVVLCTLLVSACERPDPALYPDEELQAELGLTLDDRVHSVALSTGSEERADPDSLTVFIGDYVQFVTDDWLVHEVAFEVEEVAPDARAFLEATGQSASPPLIELGNRFVLSFVDAPAGRYPYRLEGNRAPGDGLIVVVDPSDR